MEKFVQTLKLTEINPILVQISNILCKETASYRRKKQKTDANVTSVIMLYMSFLKESLWLVYFRMIFSFAG